MRKKMKISKDMVYGIVEKLHTCPPEESSRNKDKYNFSDPTALRALRIHRHLRALEQDILDHAPGNGDGNRSVSMQLDATLDRIVISIHNDQVHCCRIAYLSAREFSLLRKNRRVANVLRKCPAWKDVA